MTRLTLFNNPYLLGFDYLERILEEMADATDGGYPPYNIAQLDDNRFSVSLAVAGFDEKDLDVALERNQLVIRGKKESQANGQRYLHQGIAARQFERRFVLAEGIEVINAGLHNGLLTIVLERPESVTERRTIAIGTDAKSLPKTKVVEGSAKGA